MKAESGVSLETDRLEQVLEEPGGSQQVVMVQDRRRGVPTWVLVPLVFAVPVCVILVYHHLVVEPARMQAREATRALENWLAAVHPAGAGEQAVAPGQGPGGAPGASVAASSAPVPTKTAHLSAPIAQDSGSSATAVPPAGQQPTVVAAAPPAPEASAPSRPTDASQRPSPDGALDLSALGPGMSGAAPGAGADGATAAESADSDVNLPRKPRPLRGLLDRPDDGAVATTPVSPTAEDKPSRESGAGTGQPPFEVGGSGDPGGRGDGQQRPDSAESADRAGSLAPLPTKEEMDRQIRAEAAKRQADFDRQQMDLAARRNEDQAQFRTELRQLLDGPPERAGSQIDALARQFDAECDAALFEKARSYWSVSRKSQAIKVRHLRDLGVPEATILNLLSADLDHLIGAPRGPRDMFDVRVRAARLLLKYEYSSKTSSPPAPGTAPTAEKARTARPSAPPAGRSSP